MPEFRMTGKAVAGDGDVTATPGSTPFTGADKGTWSAGQVTCETYSRLQAGGAPVVFQASCTFSFTGTSGSPPTQTAVSGTEKVTLTATGAAKLQKHGNGVVLDGDAAVGTFGNKLSASSTRRLRAS